jgi:hypothetical protein
MVYSNTTNKDGIIQMIEQTTGLGDAGVSGVTAQFAYFNNLINQWYRILAYFAWKSDKNWVFDDSNQTTTNTATTTIVNNQSDYTMPSTSLAIKQVEVMQTNGKYYSLSFLHEESDILKNEKGQEEAGLPIYYRLVGNQVILHPKPSTAQVTATEGLRLTTDREVSAFAVTDTTKEPGIPKQFHPVLYYGPCFEWSSIKNVAPVQALCLKMLGNFPGLIDMYQDFMANRNKDVVVAISPINKRFK